MPLVRALLFNIYMYVVTAVMILVCIPALILPAGFTLRFVDVWAKWILAGLRVIAGVSYNVRGRENIPDYPVLFAVKHQSMWETVSFFEILKNPALVQKQELTKIPVYGQFTQKAGMVSVDRSAQAKALRNMIADCRQRLEAGRHVVIFPEGSRAAPGSKLEYKPGVAGLYNGLKVPCVPVALNSGLYWPRRSLKFRSGAIDIEFLPAIEPGLKRKEFMAELESRIENATNALCKESLDALGKRDTG